MAKLSEIRAAIGVALDTIPKLVVSPNLAAVMTLDDGGGAVVGGPTGAPAAMGRGLITWNIPIYVLAPAVDYDAATALLDELCDWQGERSIPELFWNVGRETAGGLGVLDSNGKPDVDAHISELTAYGVTFPNAGIDHLAAVLNCMVHSPGRPS